MANFPNSRSAIGEGRDAQRARLMPTPGNEDANHRVARDIESDDVAGFDRFSDLSTPIVHHIMSFLPLDDTTRMTTLSKHFLSVWRSFPVVEFNYYMFAENHIEFASHVRASLQRLELSTDLERLTLAASFEEFEAEQASAVIQMAVNFALENKVKELVVKCEDSLAPGLPNEVFESKTIKKMTLSGLHLNEQNLVLKCPLMEDLSISLCSAVDTTIDVSCPKLKTAKFNANKGVEKIQMDEKTASDIESFFYNGGRVGRRCQIVNLGSCKSLKTLELQRVDVDDEWFKEEVSQLTLLETLKLNLCRALKNIAIRNENLEAMELEACEKLVKVEVDALKLERFSYFTRSWIGSTCKNIDLSKCLNMRDLQLNGANGFVTDEWIAKNFSNFEFLEKLVLCGCNFVNTLTLVYYSHLRELELIRCERLRNFEIHAPNLVSFVYDGDVLASPPTTVVSTKLNADLRFNKIIKPYGHKELTDFLSFFGHCKTLTLAFFRDESLIYDSAMRHRMVSPLYDLKHLIIKVSLRNAPIAELVESLLWFAPHPRTISILNINQVLKLKFYYNSIQIAEFDVGDESPCCILSPVKCWRHYVTRVEIEGFTEFNERESLERFLVRNAKNAITVADAKNIQID